MFHSCTWLKERPWTGKVEGGGWSLFHSSLPSIKQEISNPSEVRDLVGGWEEK